MTFQRNSGISPVDGLNPHVRVLERYGSAGALESSQERDPFVLACFILPLQRSESEERVLPSGPKQNLSRWPLFVESFPSRPRYKLGFLVLPVLGKHACLRTHAYNKWPLQAARKSTLEFESPRQAGTFPATKATEIARQDQLWCLPDESEDINGDGNA